MREYWHYIESGLEIDAKGGIRKKAASGADKYHGPIAEGYREKREKSPKWIIEQHTIEKMLSDLPSGDWVLDVPCGEGRFFEFYEQQKLCFRGIDKSGDMLAQAAARIKDETKARLAQGDVRDLKLTDKSVDASVMCRLTRWLSPEDCQKALRELQRVTRDRIILTTRIDHPADPALARPIELYLDALDDDWKLVENAEGSDPAYRILMFKREK